MIRSRLRNRLSRFLRDEEGASAVVLAVSLPTIVGILFMGVEAGHWRQNNAALQAAADEAVMAAGLDYMKSSDIDSARRAADAAAIDNGASVDSSLSVLFGITGGTYDGQDGFELSLEQEQTRFFSMILGDVTPVKHRITAKVLLGGEGDPQCVLSLSTTASPGVSVTGNSSLTLPDCGLHSNSTATPSFSNTGSGTIDADCISAAGTIVTTSANVTCDSVAPNAGQVTDPYSDVTMPTNWQSMPCSSPDSWTYVNAIVFRSGERYCGGKYSKEYLVFLGPGQFIFDGTDLVGKNNGHIVADVDGSLTGMNHPGDGTDGTTLLFANGGRFSGNNGGSWDLSAPTTGDYAGILMYADRDTTPLGTEMKINGSLGGTFNGALYFPTMDLVFNGNSNIQSDCLQMIANTVEFSGNARLTTTNCPARGAMEISRVVATSVVLVQ